MRFLRPLRVRRLDAAPDLEMPKNPADMVEAPIFGLAFRRGGGAGRR